MKPTLLIRRLGSLADERARRLFLQRNRELHTPSMVRRLYEEVVKRARVDLREAERLAKAASWLGNRLKDNASCAYALRARGHVLLIRGRYEQALMRYQRAVALFERLGSEVDVGRTLSGALQALIYLGRYEKAFAWAKRAREIFERHGDHLRLARLDSNLGNIFYRQDRFEEALELYQGAHEELGRTGEPVDVAAVLSNIAVCHISLNDFPQALRAYEEVRTYCESHNMPLLVVRADYNIAYLHYLRGEYTRAIELYEATRRQCELYDDSYHKALCDLDQSELYLELNLVEEGAQLAQQAFTRFEDLRLGYEAAKALAFLAIAFSQQGKTLRALALFRKARQRFLKQQNQVWPALIDLYQALVLYQEERYADARRLCNESFRFFSRSSLANKTALCELLFAQLALRARNKRLARRRCLSALERLERVEAPALRYQAHFVLGQVQEALGDQKSAYQAYRNAQMGLESLRSHLRREELKISFLKDKLAVYESLVWLSLAGQPQQEDLRTAFTYIENAKSRSLADLIAFRAHALPAHTPAGSPVVEQIRNLRKKLSWYYRQIDLQETGQPADSPEQVERLQWETREHESQLLKALSGLRAADEESSSLQNAGIFSPETIQSILAPDVLLLEYYQARGTIYVSVLGQDLLDIIPLGPASEPRHLLRLLQFQLSKFRLDPEYVRASSELLRQATDAHLRELYDVLVAPIRGRLKARHLIVVPHDFLHYLPFHALWDGERYLIDDFSLSYAPSASVYYLCCSKQARKDGQSLVFGIPDPVAPYILEEVQAVAASLPNAQLFVGEEASEERLRACGPESRFVHIATHGLFRQENPMFSSLCLGSSQLTLFDLYHLRLPAELVTLSGCGTGLNVVVGGDELLGLVRGLLSAGAQALLVTLWEVNDKSTAEFMKSFYRHLQAHADKAVTAQRAMQELRQSWSHPYYWAPFALIGKVISTTPGAR
ncbi:MAG: CHAT domain-containing protein [Terriglobia bacterium]